MPNVILLGVVPPTSAPLKGDGGGRISPHAMPTRLYSPEVQIIVNFEVASRAAFERWQRQEERVERVHILGTRIRLNLERVEALATAFGASDRR